MTTTLPPDAPPVHAASVEWWESLPEVYQTADLSAQSSAPYPLLTYLASLGDQLGEIRDLIDRVDVAVVTAPVTDPDTGIVTDRPVEQSDLGSPTEADRAWLPWLGQLAGVRLTGLEPEAQARADIINAQRGWKAGTKGSIIAAAMPLLTGTQYVEVLPHQTGFGDGSMWDLLVRTRREETGSPAAVLQALTDAGAKPAGVLLWHAYYAASWDTIEATYTSWAAIEAAGSWDALEGTGGGSSGVGGGVGGGTGPFSGSLGGFDSGTDGGF